MVMKIMIFTLYNGFNVLFFDSKGYGVKNLKFYVCRFGLLNLTIIFMKNYVNIRMSWTAGFPKANFCAFARAHLTVKH